MKIFDTHCHPYLAKKKSQDTILENFFRNPESYLNTIAIDIESSKTCVDIATRYKRAYATIGIHPTEAPRYIHSLRETLDILRELYKKDSQQIVAIGECGLDYHWLGSLSEKYNMSTDEIKAAQKKLFVVQIRLAKQLGLPIVIHNRNAGEDILEILIEESFENFVLHCFSENFDFAQKVLEFSPECKLGFGGIITFKNALEIQEVVKKVPLDNIIIETDSPYLTPIPYRGVEENEPSYTEYVLEKIQELRSEEADEIEKKIFRNSMNFFETD